MISIVVWKHHKGKGVEQIADELEENMSEGYGFMRIEGWINQFKIG